MVASCTGEQAVRATASHGIRAAGWPNAVVHRDATSYRLLIRFGSEPIEQVFAKIKSILRSEAKRTLEELWALLGKAVDRFSPAECQACLRRVTAASFLTSVRHTSQASTTATVLLSVNQFLVVVHIEDTGTTEQGVARCKGLCRDRPTTQSSPHNCRPVASR